MRVRSASIIVEPAGYLAARLFRPHRNIIAVFCCWPGRLQDLCEMSWQTLPEVLADRDRTFDVGDERIPSGQDSKFAVNII